MQCKRSRPFYVSFPHFTTKKLLRNHTKLKKEILTWNDVSVPVFLHVDSSYSAVRFPVHMFFNILNKDDAFVTACLPHRFEYRRVMNRKCIGKVHIVPYKKTFFFA